MKQFLKGVMEWKAAVCLMYTAAMVIYLVCCLAFGIREVSTSMLWTLLLICIAGSLFQAVCFSGWIIKKLRYTLRSLLFVLLFLPTLSFIAWKTEWFPTENAGSWAMFLGLFFLIFAVMTVGFEIYFRIAGRKYDGVIGQYRKQKEEDEKQSPTP